MDHSFKLEYILDLIGANYTLKGDYSGEISGIASLAEAREGDLSFYNNQKYLEAFKESSASVYLVPKSMDLEIPGEKCLIFVEDPSYELAKICRKIELSLIEVPAKGIHPSAVVHPSAQISENASIGPLCCIEANAVVEDVVLMSHVSVGQNAKVSSGSILFSHVSIGSYSVIGKRNRLHSGSVIGADGYGYVQIDGKSERIPQIGFVETEADVDIGANTTIDRARIGKTVIGEGTKIDNLVQIGHNVKIGKNCLLVSQVGIAGSTVIEDNVIFAGKSGAAGHLKIGANSVIGGMGLVINSLEPNSSVIGYPAIKNNLYWRLQSLNRKLPDLFKRFKDLQASQ